MRTGEFNSALRESQRSLLGNPGENLRSTQRTSGPIGGWPSDPPAQTPRLGLSRWTEGGHQGISADREILLSTSISSNVKWGHSQITKQFQTQFWKRYPECPRKGSCLTEIKRRRLRSWFPQEGEALSSTRHLCSLRVWAGSRGNSGPIILNLLLCNPSTGFITDGFAYDICCTLKGASGNYTEGFLWGRRENTAG